MPATGAATLIRSSSAATHQLYAPPPDRPVMPKRFVSTSGRVQTFFGGLQQSGAHARAARPRIHINGDDVTRRPAMGHDEPLSFPASVIDGDQGKRPALTNVGF